MGSNLDFSECFQALTGHLPLSWQERLYEKHFINGALPPVIDIPTGLGKTMIMAIWLIARALHPSKVPTRLIYVVDRRTVVDQATDKAEEFAYLLAPDSEGESEKVAERKPELVERKKKYANLLSEMRGYLGNAGLAISTLRGQLADNREWSRNPSRPAIIIGTVDLIGSALLFSGYRSSYKRRPLEAGLLGQDSLLVLDEAHLSKPFEKLLGAIEQLQNRNREGAAVGVKPLCVIRMSATSTDGNGESFTLEGDYETSTGDFSDETVRQRYGAVKHLTITTLGEKDKLTDNLASEAIKIAENTLLRGKRIVVFVRKPDDAKAIAKTIREHAIESIDESGPKPKKVKNTPYAESVEVLTGTMRGLERDELVEKSVFKERWLNGDMKPEDAANQSPVFLISTSAGEVGFDLNADHLVGDEAPLDSWIQRLGRVNRRGNGDATAILIKEKEPAGKTDFDRACIASSKLLTDGMDVSPNGLTAFRESLTSEQIEKASSPKPVMTDLTDILLDAWSMTSIIKLMPGRPEVGPWLRGIDDELPQTTIAWRAELDEHGFADLDLDDIEEWFDTHRILTHETLSVPTSTAAKWFTDRWDNLDDRQKSEVGSRSIVVDRAGLKRVTVDYIINQLSRKNTDSIRNADLILPASFGGIERDVGLLDAAAPKNPEDAKDADEHTRQANAKARLVAPDVADIAPGRKRQRRIEATIDGEKQEPRIIGGGEELKPRASFRIELESNDDRTIRLVSHIPKREKPEYGSKKQTLQQHVGAVRAVIDDILSRLSPPDDIKLAAQLAADFHDHGKNRERWQRTVGGTATVGTTNWMQQEQLEGDGQHQCLGKSGDEMKRDSRGYRHEFGSLREFTDAFKAGKLLDNAKKPISQDVFDLAMHLIATHHGRGRPHFPKGGFDPDCESRSDEIHTESIRRFARLQRKYGWWHLAWLENFLRCADAMASADNDAEDDSADSEGGEA